MGLGKEAWGKFISGHQALLAQPCLALVLFWWRSELALRERQARNSKEKSPRACHRENVVRAEAVGQDELSGRVL